MGNIFSFEVISFDFTIVPNFEPSTPWPFLNFILVLIIFLIGLFGLIYFFAKRCCIPHRHNNTRWAPPPSLLVIICIFAFFLQFAETFPLPGRSYRPNKPKGLAKKIAKPIVKTTSPALITALTYFGLDKLVDYFNSDPELAILAILAIILFGIAIFLAFIKLIFVLIGFFKSPTVHSHQIPIESVNPNQALELQDIRSHINEILNRTGPSRINP